MATRVSLITLDDGTLAVSKTPLSGDRRDRNAEANWLRLVAALDDDRGPVHLTLESSIPLDDLAVELPARRVGPVSVVSVEPTPGRPSTAATIVTRRVPGETLRTTWLAPPATAEVLADVADHLAALHDAGFVHGNLSVDHVILGPDGPRLCAPHGSVTDPEADCLGLGGCLASMLDRWDRLDTPVDRRSEWERLAEALGHTSDRAPSAEPTSPTTRREPMPMRRAAAALRRLAADGPGSTQATGAASDSAPSPRRAPTPRWGFVAVAALITLSLVGLVTTDRLRPDETDGQLAATREVQVDGHRYRVRTDAGVATVIDGACDDQPSVLILDARRDLVWTFDTSAEAHSGVGAVTEAVLVAEVPGAEQLAVDDGELCPKVWATGPAGRTLVVSGS